MRRAAALLAAVAMVVAALAYRSSRGDGDRGPGDDPAVDVAAGIVCAADLADVCAAAGIPIAATPPAGTTADALLAADDATALGGEAWLTTRAWASLVADERARAGEDPVFEVAGAPLASSPVVLALWRDRASQLAERCGIVGEAAPGWRCLAEQSGSTLDAGDRVRIAGPDVDSAVGLAVAASQAVGVVGRSAFASNDPEAQDLASLAPALAGGADGDLPRMRSRGPGEITAAGTVAALARELSSSFGTIAPVVTEPAVRADVVLVAPVGADVPDETRSALRDALLAAGWDPPADGADGLPAGGVLAAIRTLWAQSG